MKFSSLSLFMVSAVLLASSSSFADRMQMIDCQARTVQPFVTKNATPIMTGLPAVPATLTFFRTSDQLGTGVIAFPDSGYELQYHIEEANVVVPRNPTGAIGGARHTYLSLTSKQYDLGHGRPLPSAQLDLSDTVFFGKKSRNKVSGSLTVDLEGAARVLYDCSICMTDVEE